MNKNDLPENEIRQDRPPQPQSQPQPQQEARKLPTQHLHDTKTAFLMIITLVLGLLAIISLFFALRMRNQPFTGMPETETSQKLTQEETEKFMEPEKVEGELNIDAVIFELDKLNLENIEDSYSFGLLEN